jgi:hypothetical protein
VIDEFAPLLDQIDNADLTDTVITVDALHAQRTHATYLIEQRDARRLFTVKANQKTRQTTAGPALEEHPRHPSRRPDRATAAKNSGTCRSRP